MSEQDNEISVADFRRALRKVIYAVSVRRQILYVTSHGERVMGLVPPEVAEDIENAEYDE